MALRTGNLQIAAAPYGSTLFLDDDCFQLLAQLIAANIRTGGIQFAAPIRNRLNPRLDLFRTCFFDMLLLSGLAVFFVMLIPPLLPVCQRFLRRHVFPSLTRIFQGRVD